MHPPNPLRRVFCLLSASAGFLFTIRFGGFFVHYRLRGFLFTVSLQIGAGDIGNGELKQMSLQLLQGELTVTSS
jgi:hypothetical protein